MPAAAAGPIARLRQRQNTAAAASWTNPSTNAADEINRARKLHTTGTRLTGTSASAADDGLRSGPPAGRIDHRQHLQAGRGILPAINPGDGHEVRKLPEKDDQKQRRRFQPPPPSAKLSEPPTAVQPISTGNAPATAPTTVFDGVRVFSGV